MALESVSISVITHYFTKVKSWNKERATCKRQVMQSAAAALKHELIIDLSKVRYF